MAFHITNRHLTLAPVLARLAASHGLIARVQRQAVNQAITPERFTSEWMVMARDAGDLGSLAGDTRWSAPSVPPSTPLWTDDFSNLVAVLRWGEPAVKTRSKKPTTN